MIFDLNRLCRFVLLFSMMLAGCYNDPGGGTSHISPKEIAIGQSTELSFECIAIRGHAKRRFKDVTCGYTLDRENEVHDMPVTINGISKSGDHVYYTCSIPALSKSGQLHYCFRYTFDGRKGFRVFRDIPILESESDATDPQNDVTH